MRYMILVSILLLSGFAGPIQGEPEAPFHLPTPEGWFIETIPFPLGFAPEIDYEGLEELRFAPGMFKTDQEDFWTYAFVWWIPSATELNAEILEADMNAYYGGLASDVGVGKVDPSDITVTRSKVKAVEVPEGGPLKFEGTIDTFDSFASLEAITLNFRAEVIPCSAEGRLAVFFELSPQPTTHEVWTDLHDIRKGFRCEL
jgi:hypothetical protein